MRLAWKRNKNHPRKKWGVKDFICNNTPPFQPEWIWWKSGLTRWKLPIAANKTFYIWEEKQQILPFNNDTFQSVGEFPDLDIWLDDKLTIDCFKFNIGGFVIFQLFPIDTTRTIFSTSKGILSRL